MGHDIDITIVLKTNSKHFKLGHLQCTKVVYNIIQNRLIRFSRMEMSFHYLQNCILQACNVLENFRLTVSERQ